MKRTLVLTVITLALMSSFGADSIQDLAWADGSSTLPLASHAGPTPVQGTTASGWSTSSKALGPAGSASTLQDGAALKVSGFTGAAVGTITGVTVHAVVSQVDHYDDGLQLAVTAPGCSATDRALPLSDKQADTTTQIPCDWTWERIEGMQVRLTPDATGGLLGVGRIDGTWHAHYIWVEVAISNAAPSAIAGPDQDVNEGTRVTLVGSDSSDPEGSPLSYLWTQTGGIPVTLTPVGPNASFQAPMLSSNQAVSLSFRLTVTDPQGHAGQASVLVSVQNVNQPPVARAGPDQTIATGTTLLDGTASSDGDGDTLTFSWTQLSGPSAGMSGANSAQVAITPDIGTALFRLTVSDGFGGVASDDVSITATAPVGSGSAPGTGSPAAPGTPPSAPSAPTTPGDTTDDETPGGTGPGAATSPGRPPADSSTGQTGSPSTTSPGKDGATQAPTTSDWMVANAKTWGPWALAGVSVALVGLIPARRWLHHRHEAKHLDRPQIVLGDLDQEVRNDEIVQFLNNASHDLASPLTPIRIQLAMLENVKGELTDRQKKAWDVVKRNIDQMGLLVTDIRDAARMQAGHLALYPEPLDLVQLVAESVESFEGAAAEQGVKLSLDHDGTPLCVEGDAGRLTQVLYNLINNALKFTDEGGRVQVALRQSDVGQAVVAIRDTGLGMTPEDAGRLFQPFAQAHDATQKKKGSGLGLFISKGIIEGHHGDIWCESPGPGKGSVFAFTLAITKPAEISEPIPA